MTDKPRAAGPGISGSAPGGSVPAGSAENPAAERIVIRDKRRIKLADGKAGSAKPADADQPGDAKPAADDGVKPAGGAESSGDSIAEATGISASDVGATDGEVVVEVVPTTSVVDDAEVVEVLEAESPTGADGPVVDAPAKLVSDTPVEEVGPLGAELEALRSELDERTRDLQRVSAEYANYRKRVDRDRGVAAEQTTGAVLAALLPVLDGLDRAREHGDLVGPFGAVADQLLAVVDTLGLVAVGESGDPFDPTRHEAVTHRTSADVTESTCVEVMRRGYLLGDRLLRPALVAVADPE